MITTKMHPKNIDPKRLSPKRLVRLGVLAFAIIVIGIAAYELSRDDEEAAPPPPATTMIESALKAELIRCRDLGAAGLKDTACLNAWVESRRRFLGQEKHPKVQNQLSAGSSDSAASAAPDQPRQPISPEEQR